MQVEGGVDKGNVNIAGQGALSVQHIQIDGRYGHLQQCLLNGSQAQIALMLQLKVIVHKTYSTKAQTQCHCVQGSKILQRPDIEQQAQRCAKDEHKSTHHGGAGFVIMPSGACLTNGLASLQRPQNGQQQIADTSGKNTAQNA